MIRLINRTNCGDYPALLRDMHADRKRVFVDLLGWDVPHVEYGKRDNFDDEFAGYLVDQDQITGEHSASLRLLQTDRPHLLNDVFPYLCENRLPDRTGRSRSHPAVHFPAPGCGRAPPVAKLADPLIGRIRLMTGIRAYTGVADMAWLTQILVAGWDCRSPGMSRNVGGSMVGALIIHIEPNTLNLFKASWRSEPAPMRLLETGLPIAA